MEGVDYTNISTIDVGTQDSKINNQDARVVHVSKDGETKRTGDFMLGNDNKGLESEQYISVNEYEEAVSALLNGDDKKVIKMIKSGKKIKDMDELRSHIDKVKSANLIVLTKNAKIDSQDARTVSVKTQDMGERKNVSGMFLGKDGIKMAEGEYTTKSDLEFEVIKKEKKAMVWPKIPKALSTIAVGVGLIALIPWVMHANSTLWHHVGPEFQEILHAINEGLGTVIGATFDSSGLWTSLYGNAMNADAAVASVGIAIGTHGVAVAGITKVIADIKSFFNKRKKTVNVEVEEQQKEEVNEEELKEGKTL